MNTLSRLALALVAAALFGPLPALAHDHQHHHADMDMAQPMSGKSVYNLAGAWTDQDGRTVDLSSLRGQPVVVAMAYTSCKEMCPLTVETMRQIGAAWAKHSDRPLKLAFFSFDSARDTPQRLKEYAQTKGLDPAQWSLYHGDPAAVRMLAAVLGLSYRQDDKGDFDHSYAITLLDADGVVAYQRTGLQQDPADWVAQLAKLNGGTEIGH